MPPVADPIKLFLGVKQCHFTISYFFLYVTNAQAYQRKTEKFIAKKNSFIGSATDHQHKGPSQYVKKSFFFFFVILLV